MNLTTLVTLADIRASVTSNNLQDSPKQEEIFQKIDELILSELNKLIPQETA